MSLKLLHSLLHEMHSKTYDKDQACRNKSNAMIGITWVSKYSTPETKRTDMSLGHVHHYIQGHKQHAALASLTERICRYQMHVPIFL